MSGGFSPNFHHVLVEIENNPSLLDNSDMVSFLDSQYSKKLKMSFSDFGDILQEDGVEELLQLGDAEKFWESRMRLELELAMGLNRSEGHLQWLVFRMLQRYFDVFYWERGDALKKASLLRRKAREILDSLSFPVEKGDLREFPRSLLRENSKKEILRFLLCRVSVSLRLGEF